MLKVFLNGHSSNMSTIHFTLSITGRSTVSLNYTNPHQWGSCFLSVQFLFSVTKQTLVVTDARWTSLSPDNLTRLVFIEEALSLVRKIRVDGMVETQISTVWHSELSPIINFQSVTPSFCTYPLGLLKRLCFCPWYPSRPFHVYSKNKFWLTPQNLVLRTVPNRFPNRFFDLKTNQHTGVSWFGTPKMRYSQTKPNS